MYTLLFLIPVALLILPIISLVTALGHSSRIKALEDQLALLKTGKATPNTPVVPINTEQISNITNTPQAASAVPVSNINKKNIPPKSINISSEDTSGKILGRIGIAAVLIGAAFFLKYAFDNNWIGPAGRVMIGIVSGLGFITLGQYLRKKYLQYSDLLMGGGIAILYLSVFAAHSFYNLIDTGTTGILMFVVTLFAFALSIANSTQTLAMVSIIGAFSTPFMVGSNENTMLLLFGYLTIINLGVLGISFFRKWPRLNLASFVGTVINFLVWYSAFYVAKEMAPTLIFCIVTFSIFLTAQVARAIVANVKTEGADYLLIGASALSISIIGYSILNPMYHGVLGFSSVVIALIYMVFAYMVNKSNPTDKALNIFLPGLAVVFLSMAVPLQFSGPWIAIAWFVEACVLYFIASMIANRGFQIMGVIVYILGLFDFIFWYSNNYQISTFIPFLNTAFAIFVVSILSAYVIAYFYHKYGSTNLEIQKRGITFFVVIANILSLCAFTIQITSYYKSQSAKLTTEHQSSLNNSSLYSNGYNTYERVDVENKIYYQKITSNNNISNTLVSIMWTLYAMVLTIIGFMRRLASMRRLGLILFIITAFKVLIDVWSLGELYRIISFVAFGVIALVASFGYIKYRDRMKQILSIVLFLGISSLVTGLSFGNVNVAHAEFNQTDWKYMRNIEVPNSSNFVKVLLPSDISWTSERGESFSDIRVIDGQGNEVPYLLNKNQVSTSPIITANIINLSSTNDSQTRFIADMNKSGNVYNRLDLNIDLKDSPSFRRQVSVYSSDTLLALDDSRWSKITDDGFIFRIIDPTNGGAIGKQSVSFPANASRYYKVVIGIGSEGPLKVNSVSAYKYNEVINTSDTLKSKAVIKNNSITKTTSVTIDLGAIGRLSNEIELDINSFDKNYTRRVVIKSSNDLNLNDSSWKYVGSATISRISTSIFNGTSNIVSYPDQRSRYIRLTIINDDNPPLTVNDSVIVKIPVLALVFQSKTGISNTLYYGNPKANQPQYDLNSISSYIDQGTLEVGRVGNEVLNSKYIEPAEPVIPFTEKNKLLLNIFLVIVVIILGLGIAWHLRNNIKSEKRGF